MWLQNILISTLKTVSNLTVESGKPKKSAATQQKLKVVVIGSGFGGLNVVRGLARRDLELILLDRNNYHGFWPLLYQVATAELVPDSITFPVREFIKKYPNVTFHMAEVSGCVMTQFLRTSVSKD